ncbi:MAG: hypothetical protein GY820_39845 [Gammaproteobacteria bacterium]|nr:hypothetical protein [Gammaproteobacteria bacterium]
MPKPKTIKLDSIHLNDGSHGLPKNPRFIRDEKFQKLVDSVRDFPEAMPARGIVVDENGVILGGNMRFRACRELGMETVPASWIHRLAGLTVEQKRRFIIMDNRAFGSDDFDMLANEWDIGELIGAGFTGEELEGIDFMDYSEDQAGASERTIGGSNSTLVCIGEYAGRVDPELADNALKVVQSASENDDESATWMCERIIHAGKNISQ